MYITRHIESVVSRIAKRKTMVKSFRLLGNIADIKVGSGAVICLAKQVLPLADNVWVVPANYI